MPRGPSRQQRAKLIGTAIAIMAIVACVRFALRHAQALPPIAWGRAEIVALGAAVGLHVGALTLLALAWRNWLRALGHRLAVWTVVPVFLGAQLAKYLPGNVFQYAARVELIQRHRPRRTDAIRSILLEAATVVLTGLGITLAVAYGPGEALLRELLGHTSPRRAARFLAVVMIAGGGGLWVARRRWGRDAAPAIRPRVMAIAIAASVPFYLAFFVLQSLGLWLIADQVFDADPMAWPLIWGITTLAWTAGFVTPGAPAGLGVRDLILLTGIDALAGPGIALGVAGLHRLASVAGDILTFGFLVWTRSKSD